MVNGNGNELATVEQMDDATLLKAVSGGDFASFTDKQKLQVYHAKCKAAGLDPSAQPFQFIPLQGKLTLYCTKGGAEQLSAKHGIRVEILSQVTENGIRTVTVRAIARDGRQTDEVGCVSLGNASGDQLCNLYMKCITKAKRRAVLSICGLGMIDETELETIKDIANPPPPALPMPRRASEAVKQVVEAVKVGDHRSEAAYQGHSIDTVINSTSTVATIKEIKSTKVGKKVRYGLICKIGDLEVVVGTDSEEKADFAKSFIGKEAFIKFHNKDQKGGPTVNELESIEAAQEGVPF